METQAIVVNSSYENAYFVARNDSGLIQLRV